MKYLLLTTIAAVVLVGCGEKSAQINQQKLYDAIHSANSKEVRTLIANGIDVNIQDEDGWTALHSSSYLGDKEITEMLIAKGADVNAENYRFDTPLDVATSKELKLLLIEHGGLEGGLQAENQKADLSAFLTVDPTLRFLYVQLAVADGNIEVVKHYLNEGMDINVRMDNLPAGDTLLHETVYHGNLEIVELLISKGANLNLGSVGSMRDIGGLQMQPAAIGNTPLLATPLDYALRHKKTEIADLLRKHGGKTGEELKAEGK
jgi:ankyrin repeat protein